MKLTKSQLKEMIREELKLTEAKKPAQLIKSKGSGRFSGNYVFVKNTDVGYMYQQAGRSGKPLKSGNTQYFTFKHYKDEVEKGKNYDIVREELKLTEASDGKWVVWVAEDAYGKNQKLMKVAKSRRAALVFYNKLAKTDKYESIGMESAEHWNRTNKPKVEEGKLNEVGISVSSKPFDAWREHSDYIRKLNRDSSWAAKSFPNKKKEAKQIQKLTQELYKLIEIIKGQAIDL